MLEHRAGRAADRCLNEFTGYEENSAGSESQKSNFELFLLNLHFYMYSTAELEPEDDKNADTE